MNSSQRARLAAAQLEASIRRGASRPVIDGGPRYRPDPQKERASWGRVRRLADALLRCIRGRGLRTFIDRQWD